MPNSTLPAWLREHLGRRGQAIGQRPLDRLFDSGKPQNPSYLFKVIITKWGPDEGPPITDFKAIRRVVKRREGPIIFLRLLIGKTRLLIVN